MHLLCQPWWCSSAKVLSSQPPPDFPQKNKEEDPVDLASIAIEATRVPSTVVPSTVPSTLVPSTVDAAPQEASRWPSSLAYTGKVSVDTGKDAEETEREIGMKDRKVQIKFSRLPPLPRSPKRPFY